MTLLNSLYRAEEAKHAIGCCNMMLAFADARGIKIFILILHCRYRSRPDAFSAASAASRYEIDALADASLRRRVLCRISPRIFYSASMPINHPRNSTCASTTKGAPPYVLSLPFCRRHVHGDAVDVPSRCMLLMPLCLAYTSCGDGANHYDA